MKTDTKSIELPTNYDFEFSVCSIVSNRNEYELMKESFLSKGFSEQTEYLITDNTKQNQLDAYQSIRLFLQQARGKYIIITHQDVRCIDEISQLRQCLQSLDKIDNKWAICGNAGGRGYKKMFYWIDNDFEVRKSNNLPAQVYTLDENFLILKNEAQMSVSSDFSGFHFYGTDLCLTADFLGYNAYVIPFLVKHLSKGNLKDMKVSEPIFVRAYGRKLRSRFIQTTCTKFYLSNKSWKSFFYNHPFVFFFVKPIYRIINAFRKP
jgi:hypothetical protein